VKKPIPGQVHCNLLSNCECTATLARYGR